VVRGDATEPVETFPGVVRRTLAWGDRAMLCRTTIAAGHSVPLHAHPQEQVTCILSGRLQMSIGEAQFTLAPGDSVAVPADAPHLAVALEDATLLDVLSPPREDFK
jgi:quercetin dioxygenase-like cupin family protein